MSEQQQSTAVAVVPMEERELRGLELAERHFPAERRKQVALFLNIDADNPAMLPYLAWCASLNLSPVAGHVWLIPQNTRVKDADDRWKTVTRYRPAIGRDGLLHKARETKGSAGGYRGMQFGVVCERDTFEVEWTGDIERDPKVLHRYASKPTEFEPDEAPDRYRGRVIGAWAKCYVDGEPPTFYYANLREHGRLREKKVWDEESRSKVVVRYPEGHEKAGQPVLEWDGAWDYTSTMVLKAAQSYVLRIGLGVTGVVPVDELRDEEAWKRGEDAPQGAGAFLSTEDRGDVTDFEWDAISEAVRDRLRQAVTTANELEPWSWGPAKCEMVLSNRSDTELFSIVEQIERENDLREQRIARRAGEHHEEEHIGDAEVVEEGPSATEEDPPATDEQVAMLRRREAELIERAEGADPSSEEAATLSAELDQVQAALRSMTEPDAPDKPDEPEDGEPAA